MSADKWARSPLTTKGDLWGFGTANLRIAVGTDGKILIADSAQAAGVGYSTRDLDAGTHKIVNVTDPVNPQDAMTKAYADAHYATGGTVTSFSAGNLSPLFTTSVATPTTTPALSFTLSTESANLIFAGPTTGAAAAPTFRRMVDADFPLAGANSVLVGAGAAGSGAAYVEITLGTNLSMSGTTLNATSASASLPGTLEPRGFGLLNYTAAAFTVSPGKAIDTTGAAVLNLTSFTTVTLGTDSSAGGNDKTQLAGTVTTTASSAAVVGSGTAFTTAFGVRTGTGTFSSSGTTVTGVGTRWLNGPGELAVGDLLGNGTVFSRVTAIASDTSATVVASYPGGNVGAGAAVKIIECPLFYCSGLSSNSCRINTITDDTHLALELNANAASGVNAFKGGLFTTTIGGTNNAAVPYFVWIGQGGSGTTAFVSTQRTTPYGITGYSTYVRRVGGLMSDSSGHLMRCSQKGRGNTRQYQIEEANSTFNTRILTAGNATAWTALDGTVCAPPTADALVVTLTQAGPTNTTFAYVRQRNAGSATVSRPAYDLNNAAGNDSSQCTVICDGAQGIDYANSAASGATYVDVVGWTEELNLFPWQGY